MGFTQLRLQPLLSSSLDQLEPPSVRQGDVSTCVQRALPRRGLVCPRDGPRRPGRGRARGDAGLQHGDAVLRRFGCSARNGSPWAAGGTPCKRAKEAFFTMVKGLTPVTPVMFVEQKLLMELVEHIQ